MKTRTMSDETTMNFFVDIACSTTLALRALRQGRDPDRLRTRKSVDHLFCMHHIRVAGYPLVTCATPGEPPARVFAVLFASLLCRSSISLSMQITPNTTKHFMNLALDLCLLLLIFGPTRLA